VAGIVDDHLRPIVEAARGGDLPREVGDAAEDLQGALHEQLAIGRQLAADRAELDAKRDLLPPDGAARLWRDASQDAHARTLKAGRAADRAHQALEDALTAAALPTFDPRREGLARDECALAISGADPQGEALSLAERGNDEALAALLSPWGRTLLRSRGVDNPEPLLRDVRKVAVARARARGDNPAAQALKDHMSALAAARGSAGSQTRHLLRGWR
jgi:hypothetical protein